MELPEGFVDWARGCAGLDGEALIESLQLPAAVAVRVNRRKTVDDTVGNLYPEGKRSNGALPGSDSPSDRFSLLILCFMPEYSMCRTLRR